MARYNDILEAIGKTPLIRLNRIFFGLRSQVFAKAEFLNPGGSIKDRIGLAMIESAEKDGLLMPGGTVIEATAGNTGVGLALAAAIKGYRCIFVMPDKMSSDKINLLKAYGAEVVITPTSVPPDAPESYNGVAERLSKEIQGAFRPNQFANPHNPRAHYLSTGPEIWQDTDGKIDVLVAAMGTGGTISGTAKYLKEKNPDIVIVGADPEGSILSGDAPKGYKVEGIGEAFIPKTLDRQLVDEMVRVSDKESFNMARRLAREEGLLVGGSAGTAVAAAFKFVQRLREPKYIVVILPDTGRNYINKFYSDAWMQENGFWEGREVRAVKIKQVLGNKEEFPALIYIESKDTLKKAVQMMQEYNISQLPVIDDKEVVGSLNESLLMKLFHDGIHFSQQKILAVMGKPLPVLEEGADISEAYRLLLSGATGIVILRDNAPVGLITRTDVVRFGLSQEEVKGDGI